MKINFYFSSDDLTGGNLYEKQVFEVLKEEEFDVHGYKVYTSYKGRGQTYLDGFYSKLVSSSKKEDIDIFDYTKSFWSTKRNKAQRVIIFHHYDPKENSKQAKYQSNFRRFLKSAENATVIVVSEYWKKSLLEYGLHNVHVIYNSFNPANYANFIPLDEFRKKFSLPSKPILYIGKNSRAKTLSSYNKLKYLERDYLLVSSGPRKEFDGPVFLNLKTSDYISLLHNSTVSLLFTDFVEGWSRIAHESILCGTPVIGNGSGGMNELLTLANQMIFTEIKQEKLKSVIDKINEKSERVPTEDIQQIAKLNLKYFGQSWTEILNTVIEK